MRWVACSCSEIYLEKAFDGLRKPEVDSRLRGNDGEGRNDGGDNEVPGPDNRLPVARKLGETSLMLLVYPTLTEQIIEDTISVVKEVVACAAR